jgi:hypothetical protein
VLLKQQQHHIKHVYQRFKVTVLLQWLVCCVLQVQVQAPLHMV